MQCGPAEQREVAMIGATSGFLIAAAVGYWVLERAENHKRGLRRVGRWLGGVIIVVALTGAACRIIHRLTGTYPLSTSSRIRSLPPVPTPPSQSLP